MAINQRNLTSVKPAFGTVLIDKPPIRQYDHRPLEHSHAPLSPGLIRLAEAVPG